MGYLSPSAEQRPGAERRRSLGHYQNIDCHLEFHRQREDAASGQRFSGRWRHASFFAVLAAFSLMLCSFCTNYSSDPYPASTPVLLGLSPAGDTSSGIQAISTYGNGHSIRVAAQNYEPGFQGYRLFEGATEDAVRNADPTSGIDCTALLQTPVLGTVYTIEARTDSGPSESTALCVVPIVLTSGNFVAIRTVYFRGLLDPQSTGPSSNALQVP